MLVGVDGCREGWIALRESGSELSVCIYRTWSELMAPIPPGALVCVDIPIGLPETGARECDRTARQRLGSPRGSSVFPAPIRGVLGMDLDYRQTCARHRRLDSGRGMSQQAYQLLPKIHQVDCYLRENAFRAHCVIEVHPEVSFAMWNGGTPMAFRKSKSEGRGERAQLIDFVWPQERERLWELVRAHECQRDDLNDAFAALWTARRVVAGTAVRMCSAPEVDATGLRMEITA
jgi:predicted RNase H-like nuclease